VCQGDPHHMAEVGVLAKHLDVQHFHHVLLEVPGVLLLAIGHLAQGGTCDNAEGPYALCRGGW
jgi:hypothetical protein